MLRYLVPAMLMLATPAMAHDSWISKGALRNPAGEWCCGAGDCAVMDDGAVKITPRGYSFSGIGRIDAGNGKVIVETYDEIVSSRELMPVSQDGRFWRCKRPDGSRRCVFGPPNGS